MSLGWPLSLCPREQKWWWALRKDCVGLGTAGPSGGEGCCQPVLQGRTQAWGARSPRGPPSGRSAARKPGL